MNDVWQFVIYDAFGKLVAEYGGTVPQDEGGVKYYLQDWQGSVRAGVNAAGFVKSRTDHQAFGEPIASGIGLRTTAQGFGAPTSNRQGYGLTEKDSTGLNHTWFRKNENRAGRWTSPDPYNGSASVSNPQSWNRYSYVESQPTNFVDPSGLQLRYFDVRRGLGCVFNPTDGKFHCIESIDRYWYDDGTGGGDPGTPGGDPGLPGGGGGGSASASAGNIPRKSECDRLGKSVGFLQFAQTLWNLTKNNGGEYGGLFGYGIEGDDIQNPNPVTPMFSGEGATPHSMGSKFIPWVRDYIEKYKNSFLVVYWVHTHPGGRIKPSTPDNNASGDRSVGGDTKSAEEIGLPGIIIGDHIFSIFTETGKVLCTGEW